MLPKVAPRSENPTEPSSSKPALTNSEMKEKGTSEKAEKEKRKENDNGDGHHRENPPDASLPPYEEFINGLNMQQRMYIQLIRLGGLLKTPSIKIRRVLCLAIANSYDEEQDAFIINGRPCRITVEDVVHITVMPCDGKKHVPSNLDDNM
ncbi:hypothetical protein ZWY2020_037731 [Hordeum vulgare]|nr:hypothetical protein ZWY2020_037731 [Hordeum vulgare]